MKLTPEQLRQNAAAMIAHADGETVQFSSPGNPSEWSDCDGFPTWLFREGFNYRPKPEPVSRPWSKPDDVPLNCWIRCGSDDTQPCMIVSIWEEGVSLVTKHDVVFHSWQGIKMAEWDYSTDRKTWHKCEVTE